MNTTTAYTPLESLLLFQSLSANGTDANAFIQTSELLKANHLIQESGFYDAGRLSPDALRELYLQLLREEIKSDAAQQEPGNASPSKKRKLQSPPPLNIQDANQHTSKIPQLVDRLYARYRDGMIRAIREDERRYQDLQKEIDEIERGEWDERIAKEKATRPTSREESVTSEKKEKQASAAPSPVPKTQPLPSPHTQPDGLAISDVLNTPRERSPQPPSKESQGTPSAQGTPGTQGPQGQQVPTRNGQTSNPPHSRTPSMDRPKAQPPPQDWKWDNTYQGVLPPQYPPNQNYPPYPNQPYPQYPPRPGSFSGPHALPPPPQGMVPSSPSYPHPQMNLPPPHVARGSGSPAADLSALADMAGQQPPYRPPGPSSPSMQQPMHSPGYGQYPPPYTGGRPPSGNGPPQQWPPHQQYLPQYGTPQGYYPPPQGQRPFQAPPPESQSTPRQYNSPYNHGQAPRPSVPSSSTPRPRAGESQPHTPVSRPIIPGTGRSTRWTPNASASTPRPQRDPSKPAIEPLSPVLAPMKSTSKVTKPAKLTPKVSQRAPGRRGRAGSTTSSGIARSHRSDSPTSHTDELSMDNEPNRKVKQESATPRAEETGDTTADEGPNRRRRGRLSSPRRISKRKRESSVALEPPAPPTHVQWTRNFPKISASALDHIGAHRNANLFAVPLKERDAPGYRDVILRPQDLKSIRSAITFGNKAGLAVLATMEDPGAPSVSLPISEDLIPPKAIVNNAQLEKELMRLFANAIMYNPDLNRGPGKAFEKTRGKNAEAPVTGMEGYEVDENKIVKDTKAMFEDVSRIVSEMRSAERRSDEGGDGADRGSSVQGGEDEDIDELAGDGEQGGVSKRRRRA